MSSPSHAAEEVARAWAEPAVRWLRRHVEAAGQAPPPDLGALVELAARLRLGDERLAARGRAQPWSRPVEASVVVGARGLEARRYIVGLSGREVRDALSRMRLWGERFGAPAVVAGWFDALRDARELPEALHLGVAFSGAGDTLTTQRRLYLERRPLGVVLGRHDAEGDAGRRLQTWPPAAQTAMVGVAWAPDVGGAHSLRAYDEVTAEAAVAGLFGTRHGASERAVVADWLALARAWPARFAWLRSDADARVSAYLHGPDVPAEQIEAPLHALLARWLDGTPAAAHLPALRRWQAAVADESRVAVVGLDVGPRGARSCRLYAAPTPSLARLVPASPERATAAVASRSGLRVELRRGGWPRAGVLRITRLDANGPRPAARTAHGAIFVEGSAADDGRLVALARAWLDDAGASGGALELLELLDGWRGLRQALVDAGYQVCAVQVS